MVVNGCEWEQYGTSNSKIDVPMDVDIKWEQQLCTINESNFGTGNIASINERCSGATFDIFDCWRGIAMHLWPI